jgi:hypothetical protein
MSGKEALTESDSEIRVNTPTVCTVLFCTDSWKRSGRRNDASRLGTACTRELNNQGDNPTRGKKILIFILVSR